VNAWHIVTSEYPPDVGGVSDYTRQVAEGLVRRGDEVHVWCPRAGDASPVPGLHIHPELGAIRPSDLKRLDGLLRAFPAPRRMLVQWVPHGFGYHSMNVWFCLWLAKRARSGDHIELMVHEPYLEFRRGPLRHAVMACVHRLMTMVLLRAAKRVWMSIPAWEPLLRPYAFGRHIPMEWLPVPACVADGGQTPDPTPQLGADPGPDPGRVRLRYATPGQVLLGHFGSYGSMVAGLLEDRLRTLMDGPFTPSLLLLGAGSDRFRDALVDRHPSWAERVHAAGYVPPGDLGAYIAACDVFLQPYPDGISSRRTSAMACLSQGRPVVTTAGHLTESLWAETGAVVLTEVADRAGFVSAVGDLLSRDEARKAVGLRGQRLYAERFSVTRVVDALRAA
jgi:glycosyltransferase involved in cell wall biosynthesis